MEECAIVFLPNSEYKYDDAIAYTGKHLIESRAVPGLDINLNEDFTKSPI